LIALKNSLTQQSYHKTKHADKVDILLNISRVD